MANSPVSPSPERGTSSAPPSSATAQATKSTLGAEAPTDLARLVATHHGPAHPDARLPLVSAPGSKTSASFRMLRYRLRRHGRPKVIAVTSPNRGEGKTTCAMNLALAFAEYGNDPVLLVEANLQYPKLAELMGFSPPRCVSSQMLAALDGRTHEWQAIAAFLPNLHVLAVDPERTESQLLGANAFRAAIEDLRKRRYSEIVLDCPAALGSADMNVIADCADGVLFAALAKHTRRSAMLRSVKALEPVTVLGSVLVGG